MTQSKKEKQIKWKIQEPAKTPGFALWNASNKWEREIKTILKPYSITHVQYLLMASLLWLETNEKNVTQRRLAAFAKTDIMMTSSVLRTLQTKDFVKLKQNPEDSRAHAITLTKKGSETVRNAVIEVESFERIYHKDD